MFVPEVPTCKGATVSFLSVVVATYKRADVLKTTLDRLGQQTLPTDKYEVIVVDDGSPDHTEAMVTEYIATAPYPLTYLRHENRGPGYSENRGIRHAEGPWILLIADDIWAEPGMLEAHYRAHERHGEPHIAVGGKVLQSPDLPDTVFHRLWDCFRYKAFENLEELTYINFWACNVSFKKDFMLRCGMFIERPGAAHEDTEVGWRLYKNGGLRILYCKEALAYHYHIETIDSACHRARERGRNFDVLADSVTDPGLYIRTHVLTWRTLPKILEGYRRSDANILDEDRSIAWFFLREFLRRILFNSVTVPMILVPMIRKAEDRPLLARFVHPKMIRGCVSYYFLQGLKELRRRRKSSSSTPEPLPI